MAYVTSRSELRRRLARAGSVGICDRCRGQTDRDAGDAADGRLLIILLLASSLVYVDDGLVGVVFMVCLARVVKVGGVKGPRNVFAIGAFADDDEAVIRLRGSSRDQYFSTLAATKPLAFAVSSATTVAIWLPLHATWGSVTRVSAGRRSVSCTAAKTLRLAAVWL